jgi:hypothetical protein
LFSFAQADLVYTFRVEVKKLAFEGFIVTFVEDNDWRLCGVGLLMPNRKRVRFVGIVGRRVYGVRLL